MPIRGAVNFIRPVTPEQLAASAAWQLRVPGEIVWEQTVTDSDVAPRASEPAPATHIERRCSTLGVSLEAVCHWYEQHLERFNWQRDTAGSSWMMCRGDDEQFRIESLEQSLNDIEFAITGQVRSDEPIGADSYTIRYSAR